MPSQSVSLTCDEHAKHANICKKNATTSQKRKTFDSSKQRVVEGELSYKQIRQAQKQVIPPPKSHWREKHADFLNAVRNARGVQKALDSGGPLPPPPPPSINPDYIQCPYCSRRFNQQAAERHINFCKEQQSRLPRSKPDASATAKQNARLGAPKLKPKTTTAGAPGAPPSGGRPARPGVPAARGGAGQAGDSRGGGRGRQPQQRAGTGPRTQSLEQPHQDSFSHKQQQQKQHHRQHQQPQLSPDLEEPGDFFSTPRDFYTPYVSPEHRGVATGHASSGGSDGGSGYNSARYADSTVPHLNKNNSSYTGRHQQQQQHYGSSSNGSISPYQNLEERSRKADGMPVRARTNPDAQHHFLSTINSDDGLDAKGQQFHMGGPGSSAPGSSRRNHLQATPAPFCYECGSKYPVESAKFCCQCGAKRASCR
ncbi:zinc finger C2HC domain-containing protein 1A [Elysia marginata]|uniref:Zinc finger C2HC domain-containing protein 1A n=1 Tax=Elysia marginata TaxID=1093978 RepID=A0AAV4IYL2_9GAST|nr:zinc finger C2HC domain-containing protein 1A [Elysia marginata]